MSLDRLRGSIPPLVTPFRNGAVDYDAYAKIVAFHIEHGSHGILVNGTTAEPATLSVEERNRLVDVAVQSAAGRITVVAATGSQSLFETQALTEHAAKAGADALLIVTPYYTRPPQRGMVGYYLELAKISDLPWMVYHIPRRTAVTVTIDTLKELRDRSESFVGMKHAVNDLDFASECFGALGLDFKIFVGLEELSFPMMAVGACGIMNAAANVYPRALAEMCEAVWRSDLATAQALHHKLFDLNRSVQFDTNPIPVKYMMKRLGLLARNEHRLPMAPALPELETRLDEVLAKTGLLAPLPGQAREARDVHDRLARFLRHRGRRRAGRHRHPSQLVAARRGSRARAGSARPRERIRRSRPRTSGSTR